MKNWIKKIDWKKSGGLVPAIIQDSDTLAVLMLGFMNKESFEKSLKSKRVWFFSRKRQRLWMKGETSGNILKVIEINTDCDNDALLVKVMPIGPACHKETYSCFGENKKTDELSGLFSVIQKRKKELPKNSYTASLFKQGLNKISLKVAEEALEVVQAAQKESNKRLVEETADLLYHLQVLMVERKVSWSEVLEEILKRKK